MAKLHQMLTTSIQYIQIWQIRITSINITILLMNMLILVTLVVIASSSIIMVAPLLNPNASPPAPLPTNLINLLVNGNFETDIVPVGATKIQINKLTGWLINDGYLNNNGITQNLTLASTFTTISTTNTLGVLVYTSGVMNNGYISQTITLAKTSTCQLQFQYSGSVQQAAGVISAALTHTTHNLMAGVVVSFNNIASAIQISRPYLKWAYNAIFTGILGQNNIVISSTNSFLDSSQYSQISLDNIKLFCN